MAKTVRELRAQQAATAGILRAMASARGDPQPVFDAIVRSSVKLCKGAFGALFTYDGKTMGLGAQVQPNRKVREMFRRAFPQPITPTTPSAIAILERRVVNERDMLKAGYAADVVARARTGGYRSVLTVPMMRGRTPIGAIAVTRPEALPFDESHVTLLKTFATQAVMAIENARLFNDTKESLERETATAEILRVIAASPGDSQPVFDAIASAAKKLFAARYAVVARRVGDQLHLAAHTMAGKREDASLRRFFPARITGQGALGKAVLTGKPAVIEDVETDPAYSEEFRKGARERGFRSLLAVPMVRDGVALGAITVSRSEPGSFSARQIDLLETFAEQAAIAIENARLFNETTEALEQQTAAAEILKVIAASPADVQPVFEAITAAGKRLLPDMRVALLLVRDGKLEYASHSGITARRRAVVSKYFPLPLDRKSVVGRATIEQRLLVIPDIQAERKRYPRSLMTSRISGARAMLAVPLVRNKVAIGTLAVTRTTPGAFGEKQVALARTFADQALVAIENARLFNETKEALEQQTTTAEILKVISSSPTSTQPVFEAIVQRAARLFAPCNAVIAMRDGALLQRKARAGTVAADPAAVAAIWPLPFDPERSVAARSIVERRIIQIPDTEAEGVPPIGRQLAKAAGYRSIAVVPLLKDGEGIGAIALNRPEAGFTLTEKQLALVRTFADQAVIAIENARLFNETREALEQQTATGDILRVMSETPTNSQPVFDAIVTAAHQLFRGKNAVLLLRAGEKFSLVGTAPMSMQDLPDNVRSGPLDPAKNFPSRAILNRAVVNVGDFQADDTPEFEKAVGESYGIRSALMVPLVRKGEGIGALAVAQEKAGFFDDKEVLLLRSFADQAVIAIENARLFNETKEALERQTATADILRVIAGSPSNTQPVFDAIVNSCFALFRVGRVSLWLTEADKIRVRARVAAAEEKAGAYSETPLDRNSGVGRCVLDARLIHVPDLLKATDELPRAKELGLSLDYRAALFAPLMREGRALGVISLLRRDPGEFSDKEISLLQTFADQAVIAIENARLFNETREALERQTATGEILSSISSSMANAQPVFDAIVRNLRRLFGTTFAAVFLPRDGKIHVGALDGEPAFVAATSKAYPLPMDDEEMLAVRVIRRRQVLRICPIIGNPEAPPKTEQLARASGYDSIMVAPMMRDGLAIGGIATARTEAIPFDEREVALIKSFADQAVIAIENARLFNETKEALERQTATGEILKVISSSPTDTKPVFDAIASNAARLCETDNLGVFRVEGNELRMVGYAGTAPHGRDVGDKFPLTRGSLAGRAILEKRTIHIHDLAAEPDEDWQQAKVVQKVIGHRTALAVPLMRDGVALGAIFTRRMEVRPFSDKHIELLRSFADQAVIAIENARLFNETKEALEQQTATTEILKVISDSPTSTQPVFQAIAERAARICDASDARIHLLDGENLRLVAGFGDVPAPELGTLRAVEPGLAIGRAVLEGSPVHVDDVRAVPDEFPTASKYGAQFGWRTVLAVPLMREGRALGAISLRRPEVRPFDHKQVALLKTFADQAAIAIENVRLFNQTNQALERQTATAEILKVIASSPSDVQPVFEAIIHSASRLSGGCSVNVSRLIGDRLHLAAYTPVSPEADEALKAVYPVAATAVGPLAEAVRRKAPFHVGDFENDPDISDRARQVMRIRGFRSTLYVPIMRGDVVHGVMHVSKVEPGPFPAHWVELLETFADQAAIAIENVRLFNETKEALERQTATSEVLNVISSSITDARPVFDAIARSVLKLYGARNVALVVRAGETIDRVGYAVSETSADDGTQALYPIALGEGSLSGRAILRGEVLHIRDVETEEGLSEQSRAITRKTGARSVLIAPMYSMGTATGALAIARRSPGGFSEREVEMIRTFADQAVIAMENVRLFREIEEKSAQLKEASEHKSQFLASMSHELRTPLNALLGFNEMILGDIYGEVPGDMRPPLLQMQASGKHLLRLINNVLDLAKIEAGRMELALADYSVHEVVESVRSTLRPLAQEKGLELVAELAGDLPLARGDAGRIAQCLMNLAGNSLKFTKAGKVEISVAADNGLLRYRVADTGIGIPSDKINGLFTEFKQTDATVASEYGGTGLGLAISKKFVEMHGGRIWVESEPGRGSVFTFEVPLRAAAQ